MKMAVPSIRASPAMLFLEHICESLIFFPEEKEEHPDDRQPLTDDCRKRISLHIHPKDEDEDGVEHVVRYSTYDTESIPALANHCAVMK